MPTWVEETFFRALNHAEFDVAELSLSAYLLTLFDEDPKYIAIPVFPSRSFRHRSIYIRSDSDIEVPEDLKGKRIGITRYRQTAGVWIRGILEDYYNVPVNSVTYVSGGLEIPETEGKFWGMKELNEYLQKEKNIRVEAAEERCLNDLLLNGEIDGIYSARAPSSFIKGDPRVKRLFSDYRTEEIEYYKKTGIFPIMHVIGVRRELYKRNGWLAFNLLKAFEKSKAIAYKLNNQTGALRSMIPWMNEEIDLMMSIAGEDYWPYGVKSNTLALNAFLKYSYNQGLSRKLLDIEDIFAKETIQTFDIDPFSPAQF
ncbi:hypothetical protein ApAK_02270 [Thermoplasmatales archaeon AK]|nr:hypothetical protein [Thermoplasmatales archaeon AK]